jgi:hypothetical protein
MHRFLSLVLLLLASVAPAQPLKLSPQAEISLITCGPGQEELYLAFGHSAIRVFDPANRLDDAFNYGVFDFSQPNFYLNYTRGLLLFKLGVYSYPDFLNTYAYYNRSVTEQVLDLSAAQKQQLYEFLEWNALPENETYRYDYFYDNCANRVRDAFVRILNDSLQFDHSHAPPGLTVRQLAGLCTVYQPWGDLGIDICLGLPMDKVMTPYEYMFLPDFLMQAFDHATITREGASVPAVKHKVLAFVSAPAEPPRALIHPWTAFGAFLALTVVLTIFDFKRKKLSLWFDALLFGVTGFVGWLLLLLWIATDHQAAAQNMNLLWALPTHVLIAGVAFPSHRALAKKYFIGVAVLTVLLLCSWSLLPQALNVFLIPFVAAMAIRALLLGRRLS